MSKKIFRQFNFRRWRWSAKIFLQWKFLDLQYPLFFGVISVVLFDFDLWSSKSSLTCGFLKFQICRLLDVMKLSQHKDKFRTEQISGEILCELDDEALEVDLGVKSKIHRVRLMKIMSGKHSAANLLNGENPYYIPLSPPNSLSWSYLFH